MRLTTQIGFSATQQQLVRRLYVDRLTCGLGPSCPVVMPSALHLKLLAILIFTSTMYYQWYLPTLQTAESYDLDAPSYLLQCLLNSIVPPLTRNPKSIARLRLMVSGGGSFITSSASGIKEYNLHANYSGYDGLLDYKKAGVTPTEHLALRVYQPTVQKDSPPLAVILWLHSGGWVVGSVDADDGLIMSMVKHTGYIFVAVDYRLAPEFVFPHAIYDCIVALNWVRQNIGTYGGDVSRIYVAGESAGGNLAAALVSRDIATPHRNFAPIAGSVLVSGM